MEKEQLIQKISKRLQVESETADLVIDEVLAALVSSQLFTAPGQEVGGLFAHNNCDNNCAAPEALRTIGQQFKR